MLVALNEMVDIFGGEGAMIFSKADVTLCPFQTKSNLVERKPHHPPQFHVVSCYTIRTASSCPSRPAPVIQVLVVTNQVRFHSDLLRDTIQTIALDVRVKTVCTQMEGLAEFLAGEARCLFVCQCRQGYNM